MREFRTIQFADTSSGQREKIAELEQATAQDWKVVSETVTPGSYDGAAGCCLASCCLPLAFLTPKRAGTISVTLERDTDAPLDLAVGGASPTGPRMKAYLAHATAVRRTAEQLEGVFLHTPGPDDRSKKFPLLEFDPSPEPPTLKGHGLLGLVLPSHRQKIDEENEAMRLAYEGEHAAWLKNRDRIKAEHKKLQDDWHQGRFDDTDAMKRVLERQLASIVWPLSTRCGRARLGIAGRVLSIEVELPSEDEIPKEWPVSDATGTQILPVSPDRRREFYAQLVHRIGLRVAGETFRALPNLERVVLSAFAERRDLATASVTRDCLYSLGIPRSDWARINFADLGRIDPIACLDRFGPRKQMSERYEFAAVEPLEGE